MGPPRPRHSLQGQRSGERRGPQERGQVGAGGDGQQEKEGGAGQEVQIEGGQVLARTRRFIVLLRVENFIRIVGKYRSRSRSSIFAQKITRKRDFFKEASRRPVHGF